MASGTMQGGVAQQLVRLRARRIDPGVGVGIAALSGAVVLSLAAPQTLFSTALGIISVVGLGRHPALGYIPAALLALIAVPYGRAADNGLEMIGGVPLRFQDGVILAALLFGLALIRSIDLRPAIVRLIVVFLAIGVVAGLVGLVAETPLRDIVRDARWWFLYGFGLLAIWGRLDRRTIVRALLLGATIYALVLIAAAILPAIDGGLKSRALAYDFGRLRLQFSNAAFLIPAMAWVAVRLVIRPSIRDGAWLVLLAAAVVLSATRVSIIGGTGIVVLAAVTTAWRQPAPLSSHGRRLILGGVLLVASFGAAVTVLRIAQGDAGFLGRILFQDPGSSVGAIESGRFATYRAAIDVIDDSPIVGSGLGRLVQFDFSPGGSRPSTPGMQPGVDDAYLTVAMKAGVVGAIVFALMMLWPLWRAYHRRRDRLAWWFIPGWIGIIGLTVTQSFSTSGYGPFGVALLLVVLALRPIPESRTVPALWAADVRPDR